MQGSSAQSYPAEEPQLWPSLSLCPQAQLELLYPPQGSRTIPQPDVLWPLQRQRRTQRGAGAQLGTDASWGVPGVRFSSPEPDGVAMGLERQWVWGRGPSVGKARGCMCCQELLPLLQVGALEQNWHLQTLDMQWWVQNSLDKGSCQPSPRGEKHTKCFLTFV